MIFYSTCEFGEREFLAEGSFGKIYSSQILATNKQVVLKKIKKAHIKGKDTEDALFKEVNITLHS